MLALLYCAIARRSPEIVTSCLTRHLDIPKARLIWMLPHFSTHFSLCLSMNFPSISSSHAYASYNRDRSAPAPSLRSRSPTLPLDEDADGETGQGTDNKELTSMYDTASHEHRGTGKATTSRLQDGKSEVGRVLKPVSSGISKQPTKKRGIRRLTLQKQHEAKHLGEKTRNSQKMRQVEPQDSNFTFSATFPIHQANQPGNLNDQPNLPNQKVRSYRASINLHPEGTQRITRSWARTLKSKLSTKRNAESLASSIVDKGSRRSPAQEAQHSKLEKRRKSPRKQKARSGRVSKKPERFGFT